MKKPSERTHRNRETPDLQLTSLMDIITNLMFFLLLFANVIPIAMINAPLPKVAETADEVKLAKDKEPQLDVSVRISSRGFEVGGDVSGSKFIPLKSDGGFAYEDLHKYLIGVHARAPQTKEITLIPADDILYEVIVMTMDASREIVKGDPGFQEVPPDVAKRPESQQFNRLFPDVNIGGV